MRYLWSKNWKSEKWQNLVETAFAFHSHPSISHQIQGRGMAACAFIGRQSTNMIKLRCFFEGKSEEVAGLASVRGQGCSNPAASSQL